MLNRLSYPGAPRCFFFLRTGRVVSEGVDFPCKESWGWGAGLGKWGWGGGYYRCMLTIIRMETGFQTGSELSSNPSFPSIFCLQRNSQKKEFQPTCGKPSRCLAPLTGNQRATLATFRPSLLSVELPAVSFLSFTLGEAGP